MLGGLSIGFILFGIGFGIALTLSVPHIGRIEHLVILVVGPCAVAGFLLGAALGYRGRELNVSVRAVKRLMMIIGFSVPLWFGVTPIGRDLIVSAFTEEKYHDYRPMRFWKRAIRSSNDQLFLAAIRVIPSIDVPAERCIAALKSPSKEVRATAAKALGRVKNPGKEVIPALIGAMNENDYEVNDAVIRTLGYLGGPEAIAEIPRMLSMAREDPYLRDAVFRSWQQMGPDALLELLVYLDEKRWRGLVLDALGYLELGEVVSVVLDRAIEDLGDPERTGDLVWSGLAPIATLCRVGKPAVRRLCEILEEHDSMRRAAAIRALEFLGDRAVDATPQLIAVIRRSTAGVLERSAGLRAIRALCSIDGKAVWELLWDTDPAIRSQAAMAILQFEPSGLDLANLRIGVDGERLDLRVLASVEPWAIDKEESRRIFEEALRSGDPDIQQLVVAALLRNDGKPVDFREGLRQAWKRGGLAQGTLARAIWRIDRDPEALQMMLDNLDPDEWPRAVYEVGKAGPSAVPAVPALRKLLAHPSAPHRTFAVIALGQIALAEAVPDIIPLLNDTNLFVVGVAATALGDIGPDAAQAIPTLEANLSRCRTSGSNLSYIDLVVALWKIQRSRPAFDFLLRRGLAGGCGIARRSGITANDIPWLLDALHDPSLRAPALYVLADLESKSALPGLYSELGWSILNLDYSENSGYTSHLARTIEQIDRGVAFARRQIIARIVFSISFGIVLALVVTVVPWLASWPSRLRSSTPADFSGPSP
jgi:HEAT repeat protein